MSFFRPLAFELSLVVALVSVATAATNPHITARPQVRILKKVDNADVTLRPHTTTTRIAQAADQGRVDPGTQYSHMMLVLKNTDEQEFALTGLLDQQQDKSSANYHQWMTPDTFGAAFGVASSDLAKITAWLQDAGFTVEQVTKGSRIIQFGGTAGQIEAAFHTEMHHYLVNGETHVANSTDISVPSALANVVVGVASLNDFSPKNHMLNAHNVVRGTDGQMYPVIPGTTSPDYTSATSGSHYVGAGDIATIFNTKPLLAAGIDGTGVNIGIIGQTDILLSDVQIYRTLFNLPKNDPTFTRVGADPGTIADDGESDLDVELSGGAAPGASINFVTSGNSYFGGGIDASGVYLVENNNADIISLSYGGCEANFGASGNAFYNVLWEQAASQGQTVFVSSGDSGPATCDSSTATYETHGYNVNALASTPFNVAVGGTQFNEGTTTGVTPYWGPAAGAPYSTALGYIPEAPLDESRFGDNSWPSQIIFSGGSGISFYYQTPSFQAGPGVPSADPTPNAGTIPTSSFVVPGPHRYLPDVSLISSVYHDATIYCSEGSCKLNADGTVAGIGAVGGTSVAAPTMAGVQALINQKNGGRQGNANYYYYRIAAAQSQTNCISATYVLTAGCGFHDGQVGTNNIPSNAAATTYIGWSAGPGYDLAMGLGSPDVYNLATAWSTVSFNATTTSFTLTPTTGITHGATQNITVNVAPISGSGNPTGDVSIIASVAYGGVGFYTLSNGSVTGTLTGLPAGTYNVYAHYSGDTTYGGSNSAPISVTISPEGSVLTATSYLLGTTGGLSAATSFLYGANVYIDATVAGASGTGTPTGTVGFKLSKGATAVLSFNNQLDSFADTYFDAGLGYAGYDIMPTAPVLSPGTYTAAITYSGDTTFNASTATPITFTVTPANQTLALRAVSAEITSGATATFNASIATISAAAGGVPATGTVTFTDMTTSTVLGTGTLGANGAVVFTTTAITTSGAHTITATYSGDANYLTKTSTAVTITVGGSSSTISLAASTLSAPVGTSITLTATVPTGSTGTVFFYDNGVSLGGANISTTTLTAAIAVTTFAAGTHSITATSSGNSTQATATSAAMVVTITKNATSVQLTTQQSNANASTVAMNAIVIPSPRGTAGNNPAPTGVVQFLDGTAVLGTATPAYLPGGYNNYVATFTTQALKPGPHTLSAYYVGDANFASATSVDTQSVNIGLTTPTLTTSTTSVGTGAAFTLSDRIIPQVASTAAVAGTVTFYDAATSLGTVPVVNGVATLSTAVLVGVGSHPITAVYSGDTNFYTSTTAVIPITVVQAAVTPILILSAPTVQFGSSVTLTATTPLTPPAPSPSSIMASRSAPRHSPARHPRPLLP